MMIFKARLKRSVINQAFYDIDKEFMQLNVPNFILQLSNYILSLKNICKCPARVCRAYPSANYHPSQRRSLKHR